MNALLTTIDNPFDPFTQFMAWYNFDLQMKYHTPSLLSRIANLSDDMSDADRELWMDVAIDTIIAMHPDGVYRKVFQQM